MPSGPLWERDDQLGAAAARISSARAGAGGTLFILGDGGLGKTALLDEVTRQAGADVRVARARCEPMETSLPFGLLSQIGHALGGADGELWAVAAGQDGADARATTFYRSLQWLEGAASGPVLVTVDDLHWADPDSLACLGFLCRRLAALPVVVVASLRGWPPAAAELARGLVNGGDATLERLAPLTGPAASGALGHRHAGMSQDTARRAWQVSGGNPLLLGLAAELLLAGREPAPDEVLTVGMDQRALVLGRFAGLTAPENRWAQAAAVLGVRFRPDLVHEVSGLGVEDGELAAEGLWHGGLVRSGADGDAEFVHPLFAQLLYDDIAPPLRTRLHAEAFTALRARGMRDVAAEHAIRGDLVGDARAIEVLTVAGARAFRAGAPQAATSRLEAAVRLSGDTPSPTLLTQLGLALLEAGRLPEAVATLSDLLRSDLPGATRVEALTTLSRAHFSLGQLDRAGAAVQTATAIAEHACPQLVVLPLVQHATAVLMTAGPAAAMPIADRARALASSSDPRVRAQVEATWGMLAFWCGDAAGLAAARSAGEQVLHAGPSEVADDLRSGAAGVLNPFAGTTALAGHFGEAERAFRHGIDAAERVGAVGAGAALRISYGTMLLRTRVGDSLLVADELLSMSDLVPLAEPFARTIRSHALLEMGREAESTAEQQLAEAIAAPAGLWLCSLRLQHVHGLRLLRSGRPAEASAVYSALEEQERKLGIREPCTVPYARHAVVAHVRSGRLLEAKGVVAGLEEAAATLPCRWLPAAAAAGRALIALHDEQRHEADALYRRAIDILDGASLPPELAEVLLDRGTMLRQDGRTDEARDSFRRAADLAASVGAAWLTGSAADALAAAGGRRARRGQRQADEFTPQEQRVAQLAASGASNRDIASNLGVSVRTVRTHLEHVYAKLGIHSRRELMMRGQGAQLPS